MNIKTLESYAKKASKWYGEQYWSNKIKTKKTWRRYHYLIKVEKLINDYYETIETMTPEGKYSFTDESYMIRYAIFDWACQ